MPAVSRRRNRDALQDQYLRQSKTASRAAAARAELIPLIWLPGIRRAIRRAPMIFAGFGDTVPSPGHRNTGPCHAAILRCRHCHAVFADGAGRRPAMPLRSECLAMANAPPRATPVSLRLAAAKAEEVAITYAGHSTYYIETPGGVRIATDYSGAYRTGRLPDVVTMNRAHSHALLAVSGPRHPACAARLGRRRQARLHLAAHRRRLHPQRHHRHPPLLRRRFATAR